MTAGEARSRLLQAWCRASAWPAVNSPVFGLLPWIVFWVIAGAAPQWWETSCLVALAMSGAAVLLDLAPRQLGEEPTDIAGDPAGRPARLRMPKLLNISTFVFFAVFSLMEPLLSPAAFLQLELYSQVIADGALTLVMLIPLAFGFPFTEQYARETTRREVWHTKEFRRVNQVLSWTWIVCLAISAILGVPLARLDPSSALFDLCLWYAPAVLFVGPLIFTVWYPKFVESRHRATAPAG